MGGKTARVKRLLLAAVFSALACSHTGAEEINHHGVMAETEGNAYDCVSCHDGQVATQIDISTNLGRYLCTHPINRDYPPAAKRADYLPVEEVISSGIKLLNGQITCISCHNLKNPEKPHLVVPLDSSNLCFICHKI